MAKHVSLYVCDADRNKLCSIYDSAINADGQAYNIIRTTQLSAGTKTLSFDMPYVVDGNQNFRWDYIKNEYQVRLIVDDVSDWFVISSPNIKHSATI